MAQWHTHGQQQTNAKQSNSRTGGHKISLVMYFFFADMGSFLSCYRWWCVCFITLWRHNMCITDTMPLEYVEGGIFSFAMQLVLRVLWYTLQNNQMSISDRMPQSFIDHVFLFCTHGIFSFALVVRVCGTRWHSTACKSWTRCHWSL